MGGVPFTVGYKCSVCVWTMTQCNLMGGVPLLCVDHYSVSPYGRCPLAGDHNAVFVVDHESVSPYGRCPLTGGYKCSVCV